MQEEIFAQGLCFYKLFCLFVMGAFLGDMVETLFCRITSGRWMSRSSFVYGHFSVVWGFAIVIATVLFYHIRRFPVTVLFIAGAFLGGIYEYICSLFTEKLLGTKFWDYQDMRWNVKGRINLLYCLFWGLATIIWVKDVLPVSEWVIEKIPVSEGSVLCNLLLAFLVLDALISALAIRRYAKRREMEEKSRGFFGFIDRHFDDRRMEKTYPMMKVC